MSFGWINVNDQLLTFQVTATTWPSFTKAEMLVCLTAILTTHSKSKVELFTDSQATIQGYYRSLYPKQSTICKYEKFLNYMIWLAFHHIFQTL